VLRLRRRRGACRLPRAHHVVGDETYKEGDWLSLDGSTGEVYEGQVPTKEAELTGDFGALMALADKLQAAWMCAPMPTRRKTPRWRATFGATGIGLCRTEHMFFEGDRIKAVREMILADDEAGRRKALAKLLPMQRGDFEGLFREMSGLPVTIRLLDPPLHEFVPHDEAGQRIMANEMNVPLGKIKMRVEELHEFNPMMGHRGCRLGITYPEITEMQARAILEAAPQHEGQGFDVKAEIMVPLVGTVREFNAQAKIIRQTAAAGLRRARREAGLPAGHDDRDAARRADRRQHRPTGRVLLVRHQRPDPDDHGLFARRRRQVPAGLPEGGMYEHDPFRSIDQKGVGLLVEMAVRKGRSGRPGIEARRLRRARRRPGVGRVLPSHRARLRQLLAVPGADRPPGGGAGGDLFAVHADNELAVH
jgi:pyruvate,orthophosphate dikinase